MFCTLDKISRWVVVNLVCTIFKSFPITLTQNEVRTVLVSPVAKPVAFLLNYEGCHASPRQTNQSKAKISAPALLCSVNLEFISSNK